jgi:hypothetical protein
LATFADLVLPVGWLAEIAPYRATDSERAEDLSHVSPPFLVSLYHEGIDKLRVKCNMDALAQFV